MHRHLVLRELILCFGLALAVACRSSTGVGDSSTDQVSVSHVSVSVFSNEFDALGPILVVGETARARVSVVAVAPCLLGWCSTDVDVMFGSSDPGVLSPGRSVIRSVDGAVERTITANAPGTADLTAVAQGVVDSRRVRVVASPIPLDTITVRWLNVIPDDSIPIAVDTDGAGNLVSITLARRGSAWLNIYAISAGGRIYLPFTITSSDSSVVWVSPLCRAPVVDPDCNVVGPAVTGLTYGTARVGVAARNRQYSFTVMVRSR